METYFAPAQRIARNGIMNQAEEIGMNHTMHTILQNSSDVLLVINSNRQIVAFNKTFAVSLGIDDPEKALGLRFGEALHCKYAFEEPGGCGTTQYCLSCGAVIAMMAAIDDDQPCERKCALTTSKKGQAKDRCLLIRSQPIVADGSRWILIYAQDISQQQHWANLENEFLQDLDNKLCYVKNYSDYVHDQIPTQEELSKLTLTIGRVFREVKLQNGLKDHCETSSLAMIEVVSLRSIRNLVFNTILNRSAMTGKMVAEEGAALDLTIATDPVLVSRVIINMLLNALEATEAGSTVKLKTIANAFDISWQVWNKAYIPESIQLRIFQKYFSTKSEHGHGLGTYRMKLLGEKYLGGKVSFVSTVDEGTTFSLTLALK